MPFRMQAAQFPNGGFPSAADYPPGSDQTYPAGTVVIWATASQELDAKATDPTTNILGVTTEGVSAGVAHNPSGKVGVVLATRTQKFMAKLTNSSGVPVVPDNANIGVAYALLLTGTGLDGVWSVNEDDSTGGVAMVTEIDTERNIVIFKFTEASLQIP